MQHSTLEKGKWFELSLYEQMGNIGTEVGRIVRAKNQNDQQALDNARDRSLELFDLTIADPKRKHQLKEIIRAREILVDCLDENIYNSDLASIDKYFMNFAMAARLNH